MILLKKSVKSLQNRLIDFFSIFGKIKVVSSSAFTQARSKFLHTAFIELNQTLVDEFYKEEHIRYCEMRVLAIDGSRIRLPKSREINEYFSMIPYRTQETQGEHPTTTISVLYDVFNDIAIDAVIAKGMSYEPRLAQEHFKNIKKNDLVICDRGYQSYVFLAQLSNIGAHFLIRCCKKNRFSQAEEMFVNNTKEKTTLLKVPKNAKAEVKKLSLPEQIPVRFIRVVLNTGEIEVLITTLIDKKLFPHKVFRDLYYERWGIETYYDILKNRLDLIHFSGKTVESIKQDFYSTIFVSNLETILTEDAQRVLDQKTSKNKHPQTVNKAVAFNVIKNHVVQILEQNKSKLDDLVEKLTQLFLLSPVPIRKNRDIPRIKTTYRKRLHYYRCVKKSCH